MRKQAKIMIVAAVALAVVGGVGAVIKSKGGGEVGKPTGPEVKVANPERGTLVEFVNAYGEIEPLTRVAISAKVSARVVELPFEEGDVVTKGAPDANPPVPASVLLRLDSTDLDAELRTAEARRAAQAAQIEVEKCRIAAAKAQLEVSDASLERARRDHERYAELLKSKDVAASVFENARSAFEELAAGREAARHSLEAAEKSLDVLQYNLAAADAQIVRARDAVGYTTIASPIDGVVTRTNAKVGELVVTGTMNNAGTVIMEVADLSQMLLVVRVDQADVAKLDVGNHATVRVHAYPDETFDGTVESIALTNDYDQNRVKYYKTKILLDTAGRRIYSGLNADVDIETKKHDDIIKVPSQAVLACKVEDLPEDIRKDNPNVDAAKTYASVVYRFVDGKAVVTPVKAGPSDLTHTIIESGLDTGDRIVVGPYKVLDTLEHDKSIVDEAADETGQEDDGATGAKAADDKASDA